MWQNLILAIEKTMWQNWIWYMLQKEEDVLHVLQWHFSGSKINFIFGVYHLMLFWEAFFGILRKYDGFSHKIMYTCRALASKDTKRFRKDAFVEIFQNCCTLHMEENKLAKHFPVLQLFSWEEKMCWTLLTLRNKKGKNIVKYKTKSSWMC